MTKEKVVARLEECLRSGGSIMLLPGETALVSEEEVRKLAAQYGRDSDIVCFDVGQPKAISYQPFLG